MRWLLLLSLAACGDEARIEIISPTSGNKVAIGVNDPTLTIEGHEVSEAGGIAVTVDGTEVVLTTNTFQFGNCDRCQFELMFSSLAVAPGSHTIRAVLERDLTELASDEIMLEFIVL
ncbi:MAG TPA: hypothetical protein VM513_20500 [Kofleriaceae bacterium]|jgi:hypothetical protein|nr:hypothetical protein [Kofleriaceae bacterium]